MNKNQKLEKVTKYDFETAFRELDDIPTPLTEGLRPVKDDFDNGPVAAVPHTDCLLEDYYDVNSKNDLEQAKEDRTDDIAKAKLARIERIVDLDAKTVDDLQPSYVGKIIIQCPRCMQLFYKKLEDIERSDVDPTMCNVNESCPSCGQTSGFTLIGKVAEEPEADIPVEGETPAPEDTSTEDAAQEDQTSEEAAEDADSSEAAKDTSAEEPADENKEDTDLGLTDADEDEEKGQSEEANESLNRKQLNEMTSAEAASELAAIEQDKKEAEKSLLDAPSIEDAPIDSVKPEAKEEDLDETKEESLEDKFKRLKAEKETGKKKLEEDSLDRAFDEVTGNPKLSDEISDSETEADLESITESIKLDEDNIFQRGLNKIKKAGISLAPSVMFDEIKKVNPEFKSVLVSTEGKKVRSYPIKTFNLEANTKKALAQTSRNSGKNVYVYLSKEPSADPEKPTDLEGRQAIKAAKLISIADENGKLDTSYLKDLYNDSNTYNKVRTKDKLDLSDEDKKEEGPSIKPIDKTASDAHKEAETATDNIKDKKSGNKTVDTPKVGQTTSTEKQEQKPVNQDTSKLDSKTITYKINGKTITKKLTDAAIKAKGIDTHEKAVDYAKTAISRALGKATADAITVESLTDLDEASLSQHINDYLKEVYSNVNNFKITDCVIKDKKLMVEGLITFNSGKTRGTKFTFKRLCGRNGKLNLKGYNESLTGSSEISYILSGKVENNNLITESLSYGYKIDNNDIEGRK